MLCLTTIHAPISGDALPAPAVVATITSDERILRNVDAARELGVLAGKLGLLQYAVVHRDELDAPGYQLPLFVR